MSRPYLPRARPISIKKGWPIIADPAATTSDWPDDATLLAVEEAACALIREASRIVLDRYDQPLRVDYKGENKADPVTDIDRAVEAYLTQAVRARFPEHAVLGEEGQDPEGGHAWEWIVDPVDGTLNFVNRLPFYAISIGVLHDRRPVVGAILFPTTGELLHARRSGGAKRNGEPLRVSAIPLGAGAVSALAPGFGLQFKVHPRAWRKLGSARDLGSIAYQLGLVGTGAFGWAAFRGPKIWDVAGGVPIVEEAGGVALAYGKAERRWRRLERFEAPKPKDRKKRPALRDWSEAVIVGVPAIETAIAPYLVPRETPRLLKAKGRYLGWSKRRRDAAKKARTGSETAEESPKQAGTESETPTTALAPVSRLWERLRGEWAKYRS